MFQLKVGADAKAAMTRRARACVLIQVFQSRITPACHVHVVGIPLITTNLRQRGRVTTTTFPMCMEKHKGSLKVKVRDGPKILVYPLVVHAVKRRFCLHWMRAGVEGSCRCLSYVGCSISQPVLCVNSRPTHAANLSCFTCSCASF